MPQFVGVGATSVLRLWLCNTIWRHGRGAGGSREDSRVHRRVRRQARLPVGGCDIHRWTSL